uniref:Glycosyltransferase n=1 Tax=Davidia involucrata TaxID=16924 RepID=A0A5B7AP14_DAVIN
MASHQYHIPNHDQNGQKQAQVVVVMVPLPAQGHLNQLLQLSRLISAYDIPIHYVGTTTHNRQAKLRVHGWNPLAVANIHFHEFPTPYFLSPPPNPNSSNKFPSQLLPSFEATSHLREPVATLVRALSPTARRVIVIHDSLMASIVQDVPSVPNAESYNFNSVSAFSVYWFFWEAMGKPFPIDAEIMKDIPSFESCFTSEFKNFVGSQLDCSEFNSGNLYNACKVIERPYIDVLATEQIYGTQRQWAIGPFNPVDISDNKKSNQRHKCLEWLDKQGPNSVIFVSFGTTTSLSDEQIKELAIGLEQTEQKFIWVLRDADKGDVFSGEVRRAELPKGFEERVKGKGMVVRDWAPQLEILGHPSTGGFMSHCGWNSCMESLTMGVPIAAWPMHSDQPRNTALITKVLKVGVVVKDWARQDELVTSSMVEEAVKRLMASKEGDEIRKRAAELGGAVRQSVAEGGVSRMELDSFIAHITR